MRRRNRGGKSFRAAGDSVTGSGTLTDRAVTTGLLYNYLEYVSPADEDGIKRAYVKINDDNIDATPIPKSKASFAQMYGAANVGGQQPTMIAKKDQPMALIDKYSPQDKMFPQLEEFGSKLIRSMLRRIVDEV